MTDPHAPIEIRIEEALRADPSGSSLLQPPLGPALVLAYATDKSLWLRIAAVLRSKKGLLRAIEPEIKRLSHEAHKIPQIGTPGHSDSDRIVDVWPEIKKLLFDGKPIVDPQCTAPFGYKLLTPPKRPAIAREKIKQNADGSVDTSHETVSINGIVVTRHIAMVSTRQLYTELAHCRSDKWHTLIVPNSVCLNHRKFMDILPDRGIMATSSQAAEICSWLLAYWDENRDLIPQMVGASEMGWHGAAAKYGFLLGKDQIAARDAKRIEYHADGTDEETEAYRCVGTMEGWLDMCRSLSNYPAMKIAIYASLAAPLLHVLQLGNCLVDFAGPTSRGKSSALHAAESCWRTYQEQLFNWDTTLVAVEDRARRLNDLPLIIDETQLLDPTMAGRFVYGIVGGRTRGRGDRTGAERTARTWRTVLITSGEQPVSEHAIKAGAAARSLSILSPPLGPESHEGAALAHAVKRSCMAHSGHAGRAIVHWLVEHRERWDALKASHRDTAAALRDGSSGAQSRMADVVALLELTAAIVLEAIPDFPWKVTRLSRDPGCAELLTEAVVHAVTSSDLPTRAYEYMLSVAASSPSRWWSASSGREEQHPPAMGWYGRVDRGERIYAWLPSELRKVLEAGRFPADAVQRAWRERGWLLGEKGRAGFTCKVTFVSGKERMVRLRDDALEQDESGHLRAPYQRDLLPVDDDEGWEPRPEADAPAGDDAFDADAWPSPDDER